MLTVLDLEREPSDSNFILRETVGVSSVRLREKAQCKHFYTERHSLVLAVLNIERKPSVSSFILRETSRC